MIFNIRVSRISYTAHFDNVRQAADDLRKMEDFADRSIDILSEDFRLLADKEPGEKGFTWYLTTGGKNAVQNNKQ